MKLKNKETGIVKDIEDALVKDYLVTGEWEIAKEKTNEDAKATKPSK